MFKQIFSGGCISKQR